MNEKLIIKGSINANEESDRLIELAQARGIVLPHPALGAFSSVLCDIEDANGNRVRLGKEGTEKTLSTIIGTQINPNHDRNLALGHTFHAEINESGEVEIAFVFFKDIFPQEHEQALELLEEGKLAVSFEISADVESQDHLADGTRRINDFTFLGTGLLYDVKPACSKAFVDEFAYLNKKDPELVFAKQAVEKGGLSDPATTPIAQTDDEVVFLITSTDDDHWHVSVVDMNGNGETIAIHGTDTSAHIHKIVNWQFQEADGHAHRIRDEIWAELKKLINARKYPNPNDPRHKKNSSLENQEVKKGGSAKVDEEQKKLVADIREELGDFAKEVSDEDLLNEDKVAELRKAKEEAGQKSDLEKAQDRIAELEAENAELKATIEAHKSEVDKVRENAEKIGKLKVEMKDNPHVADFSDEDYLDETKVEDAKKKHEMDVKQAELDAKEEALQKREKALEEKGEETTTEEKENASLETGHSEDGEIDVTKVVDARVKQIKSKK